MEVSSHAVKMLQLWFRFDIANYKFNLKDLDFHTTMEDYKYTKGLFLNSLNE